ncbi:IS66 family transposase [Salinispora fenicalii]|uniref:IS66 family transposase n=1 Tax=Salinispora fenicalii TaxID=1137263 RepID=UPI0003A2B7A9|nr:transposase [Salinispora fenicalii]
MSRPRAADAGGGLAAAPVTGVAAQQVFDLPDIRVRVTEHRIVSRRCRCGRVTAGRAPDGVDAPVQYGPRATAAAVCLQQALFGAQARTARAMADLFVVPISAGAVAAAHARAGIYAGQIMASMAGIAVRDAWAPYDTYTSAGHQLRCAHLLRELAAAGEVASAAVWPGQATDALRALKTAADTAALGTA